MYLFLYIPITWRYLFLAICNYSWKEKISNNNHPTKSLTLIIQQSVPSLFKQYIVFFVGCTRSYSCMGYSKPERANILFYMINHISIAFKIISCIYSRNPHKSTYIFRQQPVKGSYFCLYTPYIRGGEVWVW